MTHDGFDFDTLAAQAGVGQAGGEAVPTVSPIQPSTTYTYDSISDVHDALMPGGSGFAYTRNANPTVVTLEETLAAMEGTESVVAFGSGMAAVHAAIMGAGIESGDAIVAATDIYGVTRALLNHLAGLGIETHYVNGLDLEEVERTLSETGGRMLYFETISNPLVRVADVESLAGIARSCRAVSVVDNTFATPYLLRPASLGVDMVVHSATKYIAGHGDAMAGVVATNASYGPRVRGIRTATGGILSPFDAWLTLRGIRTLPLRVGRQSDTALFIADWLEDQEWVERVYYPGLSSHLQHGVAHRLMGDRYGGVLAFDLSAGREETLRFMDGLELIRTGTSLGDAESLALYPPLSSHRTLDDEQLAAMGIGQSLVRLSVGLESPRDLARDLEGAARKAGLTATTAAAGASV